MPPQKKALGLAIFGLTATLAPTLGPSLGGWLTENYGWRANFFINIVPGILMVLAIRYGMPFAKTNFKKLKNMDFSGAFLLTLGLGTLTYVLEEGARVDWFEDQTIRICTLLSLAALPCFIAIQILKKEPLLNLRLFLNRNFGISAIVTMVTAIALYGGIYSLSLYLGQIQNYGAMQIGRVMMWVGLPQLLVMPLVPWLTKRIDLRVLAVIGMLLFAVSNYMNTGLNMDYSGDQFRLSLIIRAIGQPLFIIPLSSMAMALVSPSEAGNASSIYNVMRNLGGSIGIALAGTFIIGRHNMYLAENLEKISLYDSRTTDRITGLQHLLQASGSDAVVAKTQAAKILVELAQRESYIQSFADVFMMMAICLAFTLILLAGLKKTDSSTTNSSGGAH
jgi:MFS transporter, DHA2 family, multidrug resistance protein